MENSKELLLVHTAMKHVSLSEPVNIMLTPQFYTLKKEILPVTYAYQAKRLAGSLFDGLLDREGSYDFLVYKEDAYWTFIAYDIEKITAFLQTKGFNQGDVSKIFFAQQSVEKFTAPYVLSDQDALVILDETVVVVPASALSSEKSSSLKFGRHFTPKKGVSLEDATSSIFTIKQAVLFSLVFILFSLMFFIEGSRYGGESGATEEALQSLYADHPSLQSAYTREGIVSKYRELDKTERAKRDAIKKLSGMIFKGVTLTALYIDHKSVKANFSCRNKKIAQRVENLGKKAQFKVSKTKGSFELHMEGTL
jgi:hypothetical protein